MRPAFGSGDPNRRVYASMSPIRGAAGFDIIQAITAFRPTPKQSAFLGLWAVGLLIALLGSGLSVAPAQREKYYDGLQHADSVPGLGDAQQRFIAARGALWQEQVWFWYWREPYRTTVPPLIAAEKEASREYQILAAERQKRTRKARSHLGVWSDFSVSQVREAFWSAFARGKVFAQRQTLWDIMFSTMSRRDDNMYGMILRWAMLALANFAMGLVFAFFWFAWALGEIIYTFEPNFFSATGFFLVALLAGSAVLLTFIAGIVGTATGLIVLGAKVTMARIEAQQQQQRPRIHRYD